MKISYRKDAGGSYLVIEDTAGVPEDPFALKMLQSSSIPRLLPVKTEELNGQMLFLYDISGKQSFMKTFEFQSISYEVLVSFLLSLKSLSEALAEHLLDADMVIINEDTVFTDHSCSEFYYCCYPGAGRDIIAQLKSFSDRLLKAADYGDRKMAELVFSLNRMLQNGNVTLNDIFSAIEDAERNDVPPVSNSYKGSTRYGSDTDNDPEPSSVPDEGSRRSDPYSGTRFPFLQKAKIYFQGRSFSEIFDAVNSGKLIRLIKSTPLKAAYIPSEDPSPYAPLYGSSVSSTAQSPAGAEDASENYPDSSGLTDITEPLNLPDLPFHRLTALEGYSGPVIILDHFPFTIGKAGGQADYHLERPSISRMHCRIYGDTTGTFEIEDLNSKNGTSVNDISLDPYQKQPLLPGDIVLLADMSFLFL